MATAPPLYYLYIVTGRMMLGRWEDMQGYDVFIVTSTKLSDDAAAAIVKALYENEDEVRGAFPSAR